ncbi:MAG TPA: efflux RND transporter periplasmic adaptor subunit [Ramlibacter sp.]|nr:efflux RND transporter periplasmic adaptor subunit [Ramlibacter sp.]
MNANTRKLAAAIGLLAAGVAIGWGVSSWRMQDHTAPATQAAAPAERKVLYWYDPMVPTQKFDKPGKSPFMDMQLVPRYADEADAAGGVAVSPQAVQSLGVRVATVEKMAVGDSIEAVGSLQLSERDVSIVQARSAGFVERAHARAPGDVVGAGAPLVDLLLPEWVAAQREFLAVKALGDEALTAASRQRLALLGMPVGVIAQVERSGQVQGIYTVTAPTSGVIAELMVRPGMTVSPGMPLARINGLGTVWIDLAVAEAQSARVRQGQDAEARFVAYPGETFRGKVAAVLPESSKETRTLRVRVELPNPGLRLKAGMFAQVALRGPQAQAIVVPTEAVIRTGKRALAYVVEGPGKYRPVEVELGPEVQGKLVVRRGLEPGQQVVVSAQFLIDSEASLRGILAAPPTGTRP